jgi:predicted secreted hydrolase
MERSGRRLRLIGLLLLISLVAVSVGWRWLQPRPVVTASDATWAVNAVNGPDVAGFQHANEPRTLVFPDDHGPHPEYQTEWWYYTGNLHSADGRHWGYQLTFFRRGLTPTPTQRPSLWATNDVYMAHFALTDVTGQRFFAHDQFARGGKIGLAGARADPYHVFVKDWEARGTGETATLRAAADQVAIAFDLQSLKPATLQGDRGLSQKSDEVGNASYYYSLTRIATSGTITIDGTPIAVEGLSWMDHEWSTSALSSQQVGWDWFSVQLDDGRDIMWGQLRRIDGALDVIPGSLTAPDGTVTTLHEGDVQITILDTWVSPHTGIRYPSRWKMQIAQAGLDLDITPRLADQELRLRDMVYWEGAVRVVGSVNGFGYVELTGYNMH